MVQGKKKRLSDFGNFWGDAEERVLIKQGMLARTCGVLLRNSQCSFVPPLLSASADGILELLNAMHKNTYATL